MVCLALLCCLLFPALARANPDLHWRTLETEHFYFHYHAQDEAFVDRAAQTGERAYRRVTRLLGHEPFLKTHVVIDDGVDFSNGLANAVPFPRIRLNVAAPEARSVLGNYDDWIDILMTHEFVHVAHLDTVHGLPRMINALLGFGPLGKTTSPNILQPRWIIEGLATFYESDLLSQGREESAQFDMMLRMAVLEGHLQRIDQVNSGARIFPHGTSVYLYGLHLMRHMLLTYGRDKMEELSHRYAGRLIPFGVNRALEDTIGVTFDQVWHEFVQETTRRFVAQARQIRAKGLRQGRRLTYSNSLSPSGRHARYPFWTADDEWIYFFEDDAHDRPGFRRVPATGARIREGVGIGNQGMQVGVEKVLTVQDASRGGFVGIGEDIVFDTVGTHDYRYSWSDLYRWTPGDDPLDGREQLTFGMRARSPNASPDGRRVAFVRNDSGQSRLALLELDTLDVVEVAPLERFQQVYEPRWSPDGKQVAFSMFRQGGYRDIYLYHVDEERYERITADRFMDEAPGFSPDGRYLLFSSDRTGVFNIYAHDLKKGDLWQVTNVLGGAFDPAPSHDGELLAYTGYTASGFDVWLMEFDPSEWTAAMPAVDALRLAPDPDPELEGEGAPAYPGEPPTANSKRYRAWKTLYPRGIFPTALEFSSSQFLTDLGFTTQIQDVAGFHTLTGSFRYLVDYNEPAGSISYRWSRPFPSFSVGFGRSIAERGGFNRFDYEGEPEGGSAPAYEQDRYLERATRVSADIGVPVISHPVHRMNASVGYDLTYYENVDGPAPIDPNAPSSEAPEVGRVAGITFALSYSNTTSFRYSFGSETGRRLSARVFVMDKLLASDYRDLQVSGAYTEFIPMPWRGHQVLAMRLSAGAAAGGLRRRGNFFIGGFSQDQDQIRFLLNRNAFSESGVLRGYPSGAFSGVYYTVLNTEYRIPILDAERGIGSVPAYLQGVMFKVFSDHGYAWTDDIEFKDLVSSVGASMLFALKLGYGERVDLVLQYAHGFDPGEGIDYLRFVVLSSF